MACVDAAYNIGVGAFCGSSMARRANAGDMVGACDPLLMWNKGGGKRCAGRRAGTAERDLCLGGLP